MSAGSMLARSLPIAPVAPTERRAGAMIAYLRRAVLASAATHERAHAIFLDSDHAWLGDAGFGAGNMNMLALRTRALIGDALRLDAHGIILAHSHPSGDCRPSSADIAATRRLADVARALDIALVDHLIFTTDSIYSMRAGGLL